MARLKLFLALSVAAFSAAAETPELKGFYNAARDAGFSCELRSSVLKTAIDAGSPREPQYITETDDCIAEKGKVLEDAYKAIPNAPENADMRASAKAVYSAWLTYSDALARGLSYAEMKHGDEATAFNKALNDYWTELKLASP